MMLDYMGWKEAGSLVRNALQATIKKGVVTYDLARQIIGAKEVKCSEFAEEIVANYL
jgi:isocitrate dehydrogenase